MLSHEQFSQVLNNLLLSAIDHETIYLELLGGEPTISRAVRHAIVNPVSEKLKFNLTTNGSADLEWWANAAPNLDTVILAWHSKGDTEHYIKVAELLNSYEHLHLTICINALNDNTWADAYFLYQDFKSKGYHCEYKVMFKNHNNGNDKFLPYTTEQMVFFAKENGYSVPDDPAKYNLPDFEASLYKTYSSHLCWAGVDQIVIDYFGYVYRGWCMVGNGYGNLFDGTISLDKTPRVCNRLLCKNGFDQQAKKSEKSWGIV